MTTVTHRSFFSLIAILLITILTACDSGSSPPTTVTPEGNSDTGSISFTVSWEDETKPADQTAGTGSRQSAVRREDGIDCGGRGISYIGVMLYQNGSELIPPRQWLCEEHHGIIDDIPAPQKDISLLFVAKNYDGKILYRGEKDGLTIAPGKNDSGHVSVAGFKPVKMTLGDTPNTIRWPAVSGAVSYRVEIADNKDFAGKINEVLRETPDYTASDLQPDALYHARVYAKDAYGLESEASEIGSFTTLPLAPIPGNVTATGGMREITINWENQSDTDTLFNIYWSTTPNVSITDYETNGGKIEDVGIDSLQFVHENLQDNTTYYYVVTSKNSLGQESDASMETSAIAVGKPFSPIDVITSASENKVTLDWTTVEGFKYNIYWSVEPGVSNHQYQGKIENIDTGTYVHENIKGIPHYYVVTAVNGLGESDPSGEIAAKPGWIKREEDIGDETQAACAIDAKGNIYMLVAAKKGFEDKPLIGGNDILLFKHDRFGVRQWVKVIGSPHDDHPKDIGIDDAGKLYIVGLTDTTDWSEGSQDGDDEKHVFIFKFDEAGTKIWDRFAFHVENSYSKEINLAVAVNGSSYISAGVSGDVAIAKYDADGSPGWKQTLSSDQMEASKDIALDDDGNIYITGSTQGDLWGNKNKGSNVDEATADAFVAKLEPEEGAVQWVKLIGDQYNDEGTTIAVNQNDCYISGPWNHYDSPGGQFFLAKFNTEDGSRQWHKTLNTKELYFSNTDISLLPVGTLLVGTQPHLFSDMYTHEDIVLLTYDAKGKQLGLCPWSESDGTLKVKRFYGLSVDADGYAYITGSTEGDLGGSDMFIWKRYMGQ